MVLFAYCRFDDHLSVFQLLAALLHCCLDSDSAHSYVHEKLYSPHMKTKTQPSLSDLQTALDEILKSAGRCFIIVDALDELTESVREALGKIAVSFGKMVFLTSREIDLYNLDSPRTHIRPPNSEFQSIVKQELREHPRIGSLLERRPEEVGKIVEDIQSKSSGMYVLTC